MPSSSNRFRAELAIVAEPAREEPARLLRLALLVGALLRLYVYARNPSLWLDEAMLALNVVNRDAAGLCEPLDLNQGAPVGYLLAVKFLTALFGASEYVLRLPSLMASLATLFLFANFARHTLPRRAATIAVGLAAVSPYLAGYAGEFKQYALDAAIAVGLLTLGRRAWVGGTSAKVTLAIAGAVAVWFSHPATFVLGGVGLAGLLASRRTSSRPFLAVIAVWLASFAACYLLVLRHLGANAYLLDYWHGKFMPLPPTSPGDLVWMVQHYFELFEKPVGLGGPEFGLAGLAGLLFLFGCRELAREDRPLLAALVVPLLLCLLASGLKKYPFAGRLLLFAVPLVLVVVARGAAAVADACSQTIGGGGLLLAVLFVGPVVECGQLLKRPLHEEDVRGVLEALQTQWQPGERIVVSPGAAPTASFYRPRHTTLTFIDGPNDLPKEGGYWLVMAHRKPKEDAVYELLLGSTKPRIDRGDAVAYFVAAR